VSNISIDPDSGAAKEVKLARFDLIPAYPLDEVSDPTGAGDSFAGGFIGALATCGGITDRTVRDSLLYGSVVASFTCEDFSLSRLASVSRSCIRKRMAELKRMISF